MFKKSWAIKMNFVVRKNVFSLSLMFLGLSDLQITYIDPCGYNFSAYLYILSDLLTRIVIMCNETGTWLQMQIDVTRIYKIWKIEFTNTQIFWLIFSFSISTFRYELIFIMGKNCLLVILTEDVYGNIFVAR